MPYPECRKVAGRGQASLLCRVTVLVCNLSPPFIPLSLSSQSLKSITIMPAQSAEQSFRDNLSQFRWARGNNDDSQQQQQNASAGSNPFSRFYNAIGNGYVPLRSNERSNEEEAYFALSRWERCVRPCCGISSVLTVRRQRGRRLLGFGACLLGAAVCFFVAFLTVPLIALRPAKFALAFRYACVFSCLVSSQHVSTILRTSLGSLLVMFG